MKIINSWLVKDGSYWTLLYEVRQDGSPDIRMCYIPKHQFSGNDLAIRFIGRGLAFAMIENTLEHIKNSDNDSTPSCE